MKICQQQKENNVPRAERLKLRERSLHDENTIGKERVIDRM
jgi:hypothetical protein